jgi:hypothetical protein
MCGAGVVPCRRRSTCYRLSHWIIGRVAPAVIGELDARIAMGRTRCDVPVVPTVCPSSSLVAWFVGIVSSFCERAVHVSNADEVTGIGQAHQDGRHHGSRHIAFVQRVRDKLHAADVAFPIHPAAINAAESFLEFVIRTRFEIPVAILLKKRVASQKQSGVIAA